MLNILRKMRACILLITAVMLAFFLSLILQNNAVYAATTLRNPRITNHLTTWDCIYFGSYPQTEVVSEESQSGVSLQAWSKDDDYIVDASLYAKLQDENGWINNDKTIDNYQYHRITARDVYNANYTNAYTYGNRTNYLWNSDETYHYFKYEPIKWRILEKKGQELFLVSDVALDCQEKGNNDWAKCQLKEWLNNDFYNVAFGSHEQSAINDSDVVDKENLDYGTGDVISNTQEKIFLLSEEEVYTDNAIKYGFESQKSNTSESANFIFETRQASSSTYAKAMGVNTSNEKDGRFGKCKWLLRSPGGPSLYGINITHYSSGVNDGGGVSDFLEAWYSNGQKCEAVRPALHLNSTTAHWSYAGTISSKRTSTRYEYKAVDDVPVNTTIENGKVKLFDDASGTVADSAVTEFLPNTWNVKIPMSDVTMKKESNQDGTYTIKVAIGIENSEDGFFFADKGWNSFKKDMNDAKKNLDDLKKLSPLMSKYGFKNNSFSLTSKLKTKVSLFGYYEAVIDDKGNILSEGGGLLGEASLKKTWGKQCLTPPIPIPYYVDFSAEIKGKADGSVKHLVGNVAPVFSGKFSINPKITCGLGAGVYKLASIGVDGSGAANIQISPPPKADLTFGIALKAVLMTMEYNYDIANKTIPLWPKTDNNKLMTEKTLNVIDRSNALLGSMWDGEVGVGLNVLQDHILTTAVPVMAQCRDKTVMLFQECDDNREAIDCTKLVYTVFDGSSWSEPKPVNDNGAADGTADIKYIGGKVYAVWQKCRSTIGSTTNEDRALELAQKSEICVSCFNPEKNEFENSQFITDNNYMDAMPTLVSEKGEPVIVWSRNTKNDLTGITGTKEFYMSKLKDNVWTTEKKISETDAVVVDLEGVYDSNGVHIVTITADMRNNSSSVNISQTGGSFINVETLNDKSIGAVSTEENCVRYVIDGVLTEYDTNSGEKNTIKAGEEEVIPSSAQILKKDGKTYIVWAENNENGCTVYSSVENGDGYSNPVELFSKNGIEGKHFTAQFDADGEKIIVLNACKQTNTDEACLYAIMPQTKPKLELQGLVICESEINADGVPIAYVVKNDSEDKLESYTLTVKNKDGALLEKEVSCSIEPGEELYQETTIEMDKAVSGQDVSVQVVADGQVDLEGTKLTETVDLSNVNLFVEKGVKDDILNFTTIVSNDGLTTESGEIKLFSDANKIECIDEAEFINLEPGESTEAKFSIQSTDIALNENETAVFAIEVISDTGDAIVGDNTYYGVLYAEEMPGAVFKKPLVSIDDYAVIGMKDMTYTGSACEQSLTIKDNNDYILIEGTDYVLEYENNVEVGTATVTIIGIGKYTGSIIRTFMIKTSDIGGGSGGGGAEPGSDSTNLGSLSLSSDKYNYDGTVKTPAITVKDSEGNVLKEGVDYILNLPAGRILGGRYTVTVMGTGNYSGSLSKDFEIYVNVDKYKNKLRLKAGNKQYSGKGLIPPVSVEFGGGTLIENIDYTVKSSSRNVGKGKATVVFNGYYSGKTSVSFSINPKGTTIKTPVSGKKSITVKWSKQSAKMGLSRITGYQIQFSKSDIFASGNKAVTVKGYNKTTKKISKLKARTNYYVRVRTYKKILGKTYYSKWSKTKPVTTK